MTRNLWPKWRKISRPLKKATPKRLNSADSKTLGFADTLSQSVHDAELLMSYAGRFGVAIEDKVLNGVTRAHELLKRGLLRGETESEFYGNFITLSKAVYPVTVQSLKSCIVERDFSKWIFWRCRQTSADRILRTYRLWGFVALIALMVAQTYWVIGSFLTANVPILSDDPGLFFRAMKERATWTTTDWNKVPTGKSETPNPSTKQEPKSLGTESENTPEKQEDQNANQNVNILDPKVSREIEVMKKSKQDSYIWLLDIWASPGVKIAELSDWMLQPTHGSLDRGSGWVTGTVGKEVLNVLQAYVLPPLYGWVGAMAYVLRRLISEINARTYQENSNTSYNLRIYLGVLAGLAIGWFLAPNTKAEGNVLQVLSPLALAFLAGYSVELLFSAMDKLLEAFSSKSPGSKAS